MIPDRAHLAALFEGAPRFLDRLQAAAGSVVDDDDRAFFRLAREIAHAMPEPEQLELIDAHPRLGAPPGTVSLLSHAEQGYDRPDPAMGGSGSAPDDGPAFDLAAELERRNDAYEARFGFRYCVFVAGRSRAELLPGMDTALAGDRTAEIHRALDAVLDIAVDRHAKLSAGTSGPPQPGEHA